MINLGPFPDREVDKIRDTIAEVSQLIYDGQRHRITLDVERFYSWRSIGEQSHQLIRCDLNDALSFSQFSVSEEVKLTEKLMLELARSNIPDHFCTFDIINNGNVEKVADECRRLCDDFDLLNVAVYGLNPRFDFPMRMERHYFGVIGFRTVDSALVFKTGANLTGLCHED